MVCGSILLTGPIGLRMLSLLRAAALPFGAPVAAGSGFGVSFLLSQPAAPKRHTAMSPTGIKDRSEFIPSASSTTHPPPFGGLAITHRARSCSGGVSDGPHHALAAV